MHKVRFVGGPLNGHRAFRDDLPPIIEIVLDDGTVVRYAFTGAGSGANESPAWTYLFEEPE